MEERVGAKVEQFKKALTDFKASLDLSFEGLTETMIDTLKNGQIQKFEFCVELLWKSAKIYIAEIHGFEEASPKKVIKKFFELGCVNHEEYESLIQFVEVRNSLSHLYNKEEFFRAYAVVRNSFDIMNKVLSVMVV